MASSSISSVMATNKSAESSSKSTSTEKSDGEDFMALLLAQLKYQDPLNPMDSTEMMSQLAQLNSLNALVAIKESITEMTKSQELSYACSLLGKTITAIPDKNDISTVITGKVTSMLTADGETTVQVDGKDITLDSIVAVESD